IAGGSASASSLSRPAQALPTLRPAGLLDRPRRPLSRGFSGSRRRVIGDVARQRVLYRANRSAIDPRGPHRREESAVVARVAPQPRSIADIETQHARILAHCAAEESGAGDEVRVRPAVTAGPA